jgi:drug/metabolite transporter (DMT)-like permease
MQKSHRGDLTNWILLGLLTIIWGSSYILIKKALIAFTPIEVGLLRLSLSFLVTTPFLIGALKNVRNENLGDIIIVGLLGTGLPVFLFAFATTKISSSVNGIINSLSPLFTVLSGFLLFKISVSREKILGVLIGLLGAVVLVVGRYGLNLSLSSYALLSVLATLCYGTNSNYVKEKFSKSNVLQITSLAMAIMGAPSLIALFLLDVPQKIITQPNALLSFSGILFLAVFGTVVAWIIFYKLVQRTDALFAASVTYLIPLVAILFGVLDGELFTQLQAFGMALILLGVYFVGRK